MEEGETVLTTSKDFNPVFKELKEAIKKGSDLLAIQSLFLHVHTLVHDHESLTTFKPKHYGG